MMRWIASLVLALLCLASAPAQAREWVRAEMPGVVLYSDGYPHELQRWALKLRLFDALLRQQFALTGPDAETGSPLTIYLLDEGEDVERLTGRENIQGLYSPSSEGSYLIASRAPGYYKERLSGQRVLFHEYTHHFMYRHFNSAWPVWYREGFAEYASAFTFDADWTARVDQPNWPRLKFLEGKPMPLETILTASVDDFKPDEKVRFYAWSWKLVQLLNASPDGRQRLDRYLRLYADGLVPREAASAAFGDVAALEARLHAEVPDPNGGQKVALSLAPLQDIAVTTLDPLASRLVDLRLERIAGGDRSDALAQLRAFVVANPANAEARRELALAASDLAEASEQASQAIALAPGDLRSKAVWATIELRRIKARPAATASDWNQARSMLEMSIRPDTRDPMALALLFRSYLMEPRQPPPQALAAMNKAMDLQPESYEIRLLGIYALAIQGNMAKARSAARMLASDPHAGEMGRRAMAVLDRSKSGQATACDKFHLGEDAC